MTFQEMMTQEREEGREEGRKEGRKEGREQLLNTLIEKEARQTLEELSKEDHKE